MKNFRYLVSNKLLMRSESLYRLSFKNKKFIFKDNKVGIIIDLRTIQEHDDKKDFVPEGVTYHHVSLITMEEMGANSEKEGKRRVIKEHKLPDIHDYYERLVYPERKEAWTKIFNILLEADRPVLLHCTVGKDRSGIVSAVILHALGKSKEEIIKDYLKTNESPVIPFSYKLFALTLDRDFRREFMEYFKAKEEYIESSFKYIDKQYGGLDNFLKEMCGLNKSKIEQLREKYF